MNGYYKFVENKDATWQGIGLTEKAGKYQGIVYRYGEVQVEDNSEDGSATLSFEWEMLDSNGLPKEVYDNDEFKNLLGDILVDIVETSLKEGTLHYDDRENDSSSSDLQ